MKTEYKFVSLSAAFGFLVWIVDAVLDYFIFYEGTFWDLMIFNIPLHEVYIRTLILGSFLIFGAIISKIIKRRNRAEQALRESEEKYRSLYTNMAEGVCLHDIVYDEKGTAVNC